MPVDAVSGTVYNITASYEDGNLVNAQYENADVVIEGGSITVEELLGDVNNDGIIDIADTIALRRYLSSGYEIDINLAQADINEDGQITIMDVILLRRYITNGSI